MLRCARLMVVTDYFSPSCCLKTPRWEAIGFVGDEYHFGDAVLRKAFLKRLWQVMFVPYNLAFLSIGQKCIPLFDEKPQGKDRLRAVIA